MEYDLVFLNGRVINPETNFDAIRSIGIIDGTIASISENILKGKIELDISNLIICPGFIDVHSHAHTDEYYKLKCQDGVTSVFELEIGTNDIDQWYAERESKTLINYGVAIGHIPARMKVFNHPPAFVPQSDSPAALQTDKIDQIKKEIEYGLRRGAMAVGFGIHYVSGATRWEIVECFRLAKKYNVCCHVHMRYFGAQEKNGSLAALQEVLALGACTRAAINVCHLHSTCLSVTDKALELLHDARKNGMNITTEFYPYMAGCSDINSALFNDDLWQEQLGISYDGLTYVNTGERLDAISFAKYRKEGGLILINSVPEQAVIDCLQSPITLMGSDALRGHPRAAGACARVLGHYVRERGIITLMEAIRKMSLLPAQILESASSQMKTRGRICEGATADLCIFDPMTIKDCATYEQPKLPSQGIIHVLVNGRFVVRDGKLVIMDKNTKPPGQAIRGVIRD
ncbi:unnamed protein product [Rotaria sordida]|uniref:Amidohydrolase-related domain-containing protein n=2 Tax=Rotaria sordida TaxID=392033 RepID=A0A813PT49_9BILA|nr:unnamed protein product [Rotaria sordida]CAF3528286.1 unnamed protein product [Rotaria sordida]